MEYGGADALSLKQALHALPERVVESVTDGPDRRSDVFESEMLSHADSRVLRSGVAVVN